MNQGRLAEAANAKPTQIVWTNLADTYFTLMVMTSALICESTTPNKTQAMKILRNVVYVFIY